jgi:hypothetical protein
MTPVLITDISAALYDQKEVVIDDLAAVAVPVRLPVVCRLFYKSNLKNRGMRMAAYVNGQTVGAISYTGARHSDAHSISVDLDSYLRKGPNEFRCRCLVSRLPFAKVSDEALLIVESEGAVVIRKPFLATGDLEPYDMGWSLLLP